MITFLYTVAALACFWVGSREQRLAGAKESNPSPMLLWFALGVLLVVLGLNRETSFLNGMTDYFRGMAKAGGWYAQRRELQSPLVRVIPLVGIVVFGAAAYYLRRSLQANLIALATLFFLITYAAIEGVSLHNVDHLLAHQFAGSRVRTWLDLLGFLLATVAVITYIRATSRLSDRAHRPT